MIIVDGIDLWMERVSDGCDQAVDLIRSDPFPNLAQPTLKSLSTSLTRRSS